MNIIDLIIIITPLWIIAYILAKINEDMKKK
jgi:hypothetical protein